MWRSDRSRIWTWFGTLPLLWNSFGSVAIVSTRNYEQKTWRETWNANLVRWNFVIGFLVLSVPEKILNISVREIGNCVLFILHMDIINMILLFHPPPDLSEFPAMESPVYCLTLSYIFKYVLPSCDKEKTTAAKCMAPPVLIGISVFVEIPKWRRIHFPGRFFPTLVLRYIWSVDLFHICLLPHPLLDSYCCWNAIWPVTLLSVRSLKSSGFQFGLSHYPVKHVV